MTAKKPAKKTTTKAATAKARTKKASGAKSTGPPPAPFPAPFPAGAAKPKHKWSPLERMNVAYCAEFIAIASGPDRVKSEILEMWQTIGMPTHPGITASKLAAQARDHVNFRKGYYREGHNGAHRWAARAKARQDIGAAHDSSAILIAKAQARVCGASALWRAIAKQREEWSKRETISDHLFELGLVKKMGKYDLDLSEPPPRHLRPDRHYGPFYNPNPYEQDPGRLPAGFDQLDFDRHGYVKGILPDFEIDHEVTLSPWPEESDVEIDLLSE